MQAGLGAYRLAMCLEDGTLLTEGLLRDVGVGCGSNLSVVVESARRRVAFMFTGEFSQYEGMGRELYESEPVFRGVIDRCDEALAGQLPHHLMMVLYGGDDQTTALIHDTRYGQPALFALGCATAALWRSKGVEPVAVLGHGVGEFSAACIAGVMTLEAGARLVAEHARLISELPCTGCIEAVVASADEMHAAISVADVGDAVSVSFINAPRAVCVSGTEAAVAAVTGGKKHRRLPGLPALHSPLMAQIVDDMRAAAALAGLNATTRVPIVSAVTGRVASSGEMGIPEYWAQRILQPVNFVEQMQSLGRLGCDTFVEVGPMGMLSRLGRKCLEGELTWLSSMEKKKSATAVMEASEARLVEGTPHPLFHSNLAVAPALIQT